MNASELQGLEEEVKLLKSSMVNMAKARWRGQFRASGHWENHGRNGKNTGKTMGKTQEKLENHGKTCKMAMYKVLPPDVMFVGL